MTQYNLKGETLILRVKKAPIIVSVMLFALAFVSFILPLTGLIFGVFMGHGFHFGYLIGLFLFGLIGYYLLRVSLWNTYGQEILKFGRSTIVYQADYGWFKDGAQHISRKDVICYTEKLGYEADDTGVLIITNTTEAIRSVVKMPTSEIETLLKHITTLIT